MSSLGRPTGKARGSKHQARIDAQGVVFHPTKAPQWFASREAHMKERFIGVVAVYMLVPAMLFGQPADKKQLVGVWEVKEAAVEQSRPPLLSLAMFGGDGS